MHETVSADMGTKIITFYFHSVSSQMTEMALPEVRQLAKRRCFGEVSARTEAAIAKAMVNLMKVMLLSEVIRSQK